MNSVTISKPDYNRLKRLEKLNQDLLLKLVKSLTDVQNKRIRKIN